MPFLVDGKIVRINAERTVRSKLQKERGYCSDDNVQLLASIYVFAEQDTETPRRNDSNVH